MTVPTLPAILLRKLCLLTAVVNMAGNVIIVFFHRPIYTWLGVPLPVDMYHFLLESVLSFTIGVAALLVFLHPDRAIGLLKICIIGKGAYAVVTFTFFAVGRLHWFPLLYAAWDAVFVLIFFLYWIQLESSDLLQLEHQTMAGLKRPNSNRALIIGFSLTGNGAKAIECLTEGLRTGGYEVDTISPTPYDKIYRFPMSFIEFVKIILRAFVRAPTRIQPVETPNDDYDLVIVESPTWLLGMAAPVEAVLQDPSNRRLFCGRDAAALVVCRGAYQRTRAMIVRHLERCGANVVAARSWTHQGFEPRRLMSLWFYLIFRRAGVPPLLAEPRYGLSDKSLSEIKIYGQSLARRTRSRLDWTLINPEES
ncbi:MAG: hypothetical protein MI923_12180 [Phycisphaerales bacterium]|nr:hypothetical protein [Phycisphaerales bacterium]